MKSFLLISIVTLFLAGNVFADDIFIKAGNSSANSNEIRLVSSDDSRTVIDVKLNGFYNKKVNIAGNLYDNIYLNEFVSLGNEGQAALPTITKMIAIPNYKDVRVVINNAESQVFNSFDVIPYQTPPLRNTNGITDVFQKDNSYYSSNKNSPENIVSIKEIAVMRDYRIAVVTINPVQYNPSLRQLKVYTDINFELKYEGYSNVNNVTYKSEGISKSFRNIYKQLIFNYSEDNTFTVAPKMLVIVPDSLESAITPYVSWKTKKGIKTTVKKRSEISGVTFPSSIEIKSFLINLYNSPDRPEYVLMIGDARGNNTITWFNATGGKSDHPYMCLDGTDILPDIVVGRISVQSLTELDTAITKLVQYEKQPNVTETDWYKRALVLHSNDGIDPINMQVARSVFMNEGGFTNVDVASPSTSSAQITNYINGGVSWIWFIGHGSETSWADPVWSMSNMVNLNYGYKQPSIISIACSNTDLDYSQTADCFGEAWIERSHKNSASNFTGSTELCAFYTTDTIGREMLYAYFRHGITDFGSMLNYGKIQAYNYFGGNGTVTETIHQFMLLGDPTQEAYSDVPKSLNVSTSLAGSEYSVNVKAAGINSKGALVAINQNNELKIAGYTDSLGNYRFNSSVIENSVPVNLVVTGKNLLPYDGDMILTNINNISQLAQSYSLSQNYPNPFNPATNINFSIPKNSFVSLKIFDVLGKEVATLVNENLNPGSYNFDFNASNISSGVYFYRITAGRVF
ncbi:MAG: T9SS type A sorting domain-containing protein [Ignavibacteria bacterium]|nr:T9SS type A sorting domain-containing protein [Ignavibacteria bacterium]